MTWCFSGNQTGLPISVLFSTRSRPVDLRSRKEAGHREHYVAQRHHRALTQLEGFFSNPVKEKTGRYVCPLNSAGSTLLRSETYTRWVLYWGAGQGAVLAQVKGCVSKLSHTLVAAWLTPKLGSTLSDSGCLANVSVVKKLRPYLYRQ